MPSFTPKCRDCRRNLPPSVAKVHYANGFRCSDCALVFDNGREYAKLPARARVDHKHPQKETLFDA